MGQIAVNIAGVMVTPAATTSLATVSVPLASMDTTAFRVSEDVCC